MLIQIFWRHWNNKKQLRRHLQAKKVQEQRKQRLRQAQESLMKAKQIESDKWRRAAELLEQGSAGSLNIPTVIKEIRRLFDPSS